MIYFLFSIFYFLPPALFAGGAGSTASPFLKVPISGRAAALGGAISALEGDVSVMDYNPAGLSGLDRADIMATYIDYLEDTSLQSLSIGYPLSMKKITPLGGNNMRDTEGEVRSTTIGLEYRAFRAKDVERNNIGIKGDQFNIRDQLFAVSLGVPMTERLSLGATFKSISNKIQDDSVSTYALDGGVLYHLMPRWNVAAAIQNLGSGKALDQVSDPLPLTGRIGVSREGDRFVLMADLANGRDSVFRKSGGVEWIANRFLRFRGGLLHDTTLQLTGGLGIRMSGPQKAPAAARSSSSYARDERVESGVANRILSNMAKKLTRNTIEAGMNSPKPSIAVIPFNSRDIGAGTRITTTFFELFSNNGDFRPVDRAAVARAVELKRLPPTGMVDNASAVDIGMMVDCPLLLLGTVDKGDERYIINARVVETETGNVLATDMAEIAYEDFLQQKPVKRKLSYQEEAPRSSFQPGSSNVDLGIDYGLATHTDLGITHTVSLRIFY